MGWIVCHGHEGCSIHKSGLGGGLYVFRYRREIARALPIHSMEKREEVRRAVCLRTIVADKTGLATAQMTDLSERGCRLYLFRASTPRQYLTLKVYPDDGTAALQIDLAKVRWSGHQIAGVQFLSLSPQNMIRLARLCGDSDE